METTQISCKHCGSTDVVKIGFHAGTQRYLCHTCGRKFKADSSPFHMSTPAPDIAGALAMYYTGSSITDIRNHIRQQTGYYPSKSVVFGWIQKYTDSAASHFAKAKPKVGDSWIADETMIDLDKGIKVWFWDMIDAKTRFLLASRVSLTRTTEDAKRLVQDAVKRAGKPPKEILTDKMKSYPDAIFTALGGYTEHVQGSPFKVRATEESTSRVERFHETLKERTKVMKAFRDIDTLIDFAKGFLTYYNFLKPHEALKGKTPAEKAKLRYDVKTWADVVNMPVPLEVERARRISPRLKLEQPKVSTAGAFKRKRPRQPFQRRLPIGGVYSDRKGERLSRKPHGGWRRIA
jgi:putative transposase